MKRIIVEVILIKSLIFCSQFDFLTFGQLANAEKNAIVNLKPEEENLNVFQQWVRWNNPGSMLLHFLTKDAVSCYDRRSQSVAQIKTESEWKDRQNFIRTKLNELIGTFPERTPLNAKITGIIKKDGYRIEKVVFESFPRFYVTGILYVPEMIRGKVPAVLNVIGHNQEAFRNELYQVINYNLVKKGIVVFAIDPPGQGEHVQQYDPAVKFSSVGYSVVEHNYFGNWCFLSGYSCAKYFIWDGIRAIDYLVSRKEVDQDRIGVTGFSGGGTITSYIGALDERIKVAIPCSWATANKRLLETKAASDAEAILYHGAVSGISFEDLIELRAPKPTLLTFVSRDEYLCLQGAREAFAEASKAYSAFGQKENLVFIEEDSKHWLTPNIRLAIYSFFMKHFNLKGDPSEIEAEVLPREELRVTPTGQIATYLGGEMIFDLNKKLTEKLIADLDRSRENDHEHISKAVSSAKKLSGFIDPDNSGNEFFINGKYQRKGYTMAKYAIEVGNDYAIPVLLFVPDDVNSKYPAVIYLNPRGKSDQANPGGRIEELVMQGLVVAAVDLPGIGEIKNTAGREHTDSYTALLVGKSIPGIRAESIIRVAKALSMLPFVDSEKIGAIGIDDLCIPLIHAASFNQIIDFLLLDGAPVSYRAIAMNRNYRIGFTSREGGGYWHPYEVDFTWGVAGALKSYDLPDLIAGIAPRKIVFAGMKNEMMEQADEETIKTELSFPISAYKSMGAADNIRQEKSGISYISLVNWCLNK